MTENIIYNTTFAFDPESQDDWKSWIALELQTLKTLEFVKQCNVFKVLSNQAGQQLTYAVQIQLNDLASVHLLERKYIPAMNGRLSAHFGDAVVFFSTVLQKAF